MVRDSAGVRIVESLRPPADSRLGWQIGAEPDVSIGALEGEAPYLLDRVQGALTLADGRIVVRNVGSRDLRVFDASGSHLATWGGAGDGPGEFENLFGVGRWPGDSLIAWFAQGRRLSVFDGEGNFGRTFGLEGSAHREPQVGLPAGRINGGSCESGTGIPMSPLFRPALAGIVGASVLAATGCAGVQPIPEPAILQPYNGEWVLQAEDPSPASARSAWEGRCPMKYAIVIERTLNGYSAYVPDLPGCVAAADSYEKAEKLIREAVVFHLESLRGDGDPIPRP